MIAKLITWDRIGPEGHQAHAFEPWMSTALPG